MEPRRWIFFREFRRPQESPESAADDNHLVCFVLCARRLDSRDEQVYGMRNLLNNFWHILRLDDLSSRELCLFSLVDVVVVVAEQYKRFSRARKNAIWAQKLASTREWTFIAGDMIMGGMRSRAQRNRLKVKAPLLFMETEKLFFIECRCRDVLDVAEPLDAVFIIKQKQQKKNLTRACRLG